MVKKGGLHQVSFSHNGLYKQMQYRRMYVCLLKHAEQISAERGKQFAFALFGFALPGKNVTYQTRVNGKSNQN